MLPCSCNTLTYFAFHFLHFEQGMKKDVRTALVVLALAVLPLVTGVPAPVLDTVVAHPVFVKAVWMGALLWLLYNHYTLTALVVIVLGLTLRFEVFGSYVYSHDGILAKYAAIARADPRFDASKDVDLQISEGTLHRDPARWLDSGKPPKTLLLFPPTESQLALAGSNGHVSQ